jgi:hypothetical protein
MIRLSLTNYLICPHCKCINLWHFRSISIHSWLDMFRWILFGVCSIGLNFRRKSIGLAWATILSPCSAHNGSNLTKRHIHHFIAIVTRPICWLSLIRNVWRDSVPLNTCRWIQWSHFITLSLCRKNWGNFFKLSWLNWTLWWIVFGCEVIVI